MISSAKGKEQNKGKGKRAKGKGMVNFLALLGNYSL